MRFCLCLLVGYYVNERSCLYWTQLQLCFSCKLLLKLSLEYIKFLHIIRMFWAHYITYCRKAVTCKSNVELSKQDEKLGLTNK